jgi:hypothetical protein
MVEGEKASAAPAGSKAGFDKIEHRILTLGAGPCSPCQGGPSTGNENRYGWQKKRPWWIGWLTATTNFPDLVMTLVHER